MSSLSGISAFTGSTSSTADSSAAKLADDLDQFLQILTTQLSNQDPLSPMDSTEFTNQLVQFANVEQGINTNKNLEGLIDITQANVTSSAVGYIDKVIQAQSNFVPLQDGNAKFTVTLDQDAQSCIVAITDDKGNIVKALQGQTEAGTHTYEWDGLDSDGNTLPDGVYNVNVTPMGASEEDQINVYTTSFGQVSAVANDSGEMLLSMGGILVNMEDVIAVHNAGTSTDTVSNDTSSGNESTDEESDS